MTINQTRDRGLNQDQSAPPPSIVIESVAPLIDGGRYPVKREVGDWLEVEADIFREGHDQLLAFLLVRSAASPEWLSIPMAELGNDRWAARARLEEIGKYRYTIEAFPDRFGSWVDEVHKKAAAGLALDSELLEGAELVREAAARHLVSAALQQAIRLIDSGQSSDTKLASLLADDLTTAMVDARDPLLATRFAPELSVTVDRERARFAAWYELFPRSAGQKPGKSATFDDVIALLPMIRDAGFDVLYFPPIHPIGTTNRKGANNSLVALPGEPGSPYAIGGAAGGHDAIEPSLGTLADFHRLVEATVSHGMEIALDLAIQVSPDHPWASEHPEWFFVRPDGSIKFAENPPKKYEDIYPVNFTTPAWQSLWQEIRRIVLFWIDQGVTIFRVDNPHTKPVAFWEWLISEIQSAHPETIFLSEAFTRPKVMKALAKAGFTQSYSYFTWRNHKSELIEYFTELTNPPVSDYMRANLFTNTPDILPELLQQGGRAAFKIRLTLAATLSSVYGIYSGFELCEATPVPGKEEYLNSEKYEFKVWDWDRPGNIRDYVTKINVIRRSHPALHEYDNLTFHRADDDAVLAYSKLDSPTGDAILVVVNIDPFNARETMLHFDPALLGLPQSSPYTARELISGQLWSWSGGDQYVRLDPHDEPAHIIQLVPDNGDMN